jgi:hypothetical protein
VMCNGIRSRCWRRSVPKSRGATRALTDSEAPDVRRDMNDVAFRIVLGATEEAAPKRSSPVVSAPAETTRAAEPVGAWGRGASVVLGALTSAYPCVTSTGRLSMRDLRR